MFGVPLRILVGRRNEVEEFRPQQVSLLNSKIQVFGSDSNSFANSCLTSR